MMPIIILRRRMFVNAIFIMQKMFTNPEIRVNILRNPHFCATMEADSENVISKKGFYQ